MLRYQVEDKQYFKFRESLSQRAFTVDDLDQFSLFVGIHNFARKKYIIDQFNETLDISGHIYEFGTWKGASLILLASWYKLMRPQGTKKIHVFDTFAGLSDGTQEDGQAFKKYNGCYQSDSQQLIDIIETRGLQDYINFVVGDACKTTAPHFEKMAYKKVSFALFDMDLYEPTKAAIDGVLPNLVVGGKIIFDEGTVEAWEGEQRALNYLVDQAEKLGIHYQLTENPITRQPTTLFTRIR